MIISGSQCEIWGLSANEITLTDLFDQSEACDCHDGSYLVCDTQCDNQPLILSQSCHLCLVWAQRQQRHSLEAQAGGHGEPHRDPGSRDPGGGWSGPGPSGQDHED